MYYENNKHFVFLKEIKHSSIDLV